LSTLDEEWCVKRSSSQFGNLTNLAMLVETVCAVRNSQLLLKPVGINEDLASIFAKEAEGDTERGV
jgi:hypothetical protein